MDMPLAEVIDRYTILKLKNERIGGDEILEALKEYYAEIKKQLDNSIVQKWINKLYNINSEIWELEFDIRKGKEKKLGLEEVGRRAIKIREFNKQRVSIKNEITQMMGDGFQDIKMNHASE